jgi:HSP20 family molecular chaperone IbpA
MERDNWDEFDKWIDKIEKIMQSNFSGAIKTGDKTSQDPIEITQDEDNIYVTLDLTNVNVQEDDIFINLTPDFIIFRILMANSEYERAVSLPTKAEVKSIVKSYNNGVLDLVIKKRKEELNDNNNGKNNLLQSV